MSEVQELLALNPTSRVRAYFQLLRPPNLFTLPGDVLVGTAVGGALLNPGSFLLAVFSVLFLYESGIVLNDYADRFVDRRERPTRPIPCGAVPASNALILGLGLMGLGIAFAYSLSVFTGHLSVALSGFILLYNFSLKHSPLLGPPVMAGCRVFSVLMGYSVTIEYSLEIRGILLCSAVFLYTLGICLVARDETRDAPPSFPKLSLPLILATPVWLVLLVLTQPSTATTLAFLFIALTGSEILFKAYRIRRQELPLPPYIGQLIRLMIPVQAALYLLSSPRAGLNEILTVAVFAIFFRLFASLSSKFFYQS